MTTPDMSSSGSSMTRPGTNRDAGTNAGTGTSARQQIRDVKDQVVDQAKNTFEQARSRASTSLGESRGQVAEQMGGVANAFRRTGEQLRNENQDRLAGLTDTVANQVEQVAKYMRDRSPQEMRADLERLARRQPAAMIGGAFAIGLLAARFFKSSRSDGGQDTSGRDQYGSRDYDAGTRRPGEPNYPPPTGGLNPSGGNVGGGYGGA